MRSHACYRLTKVSSDAQQEWNDISPCVTSFIQCGVSFGMFFVQLKCACCDYSTTDDLFFTMLDDDPIWASVCERTSGNLQVRLSDQADGFYSFVQRNAGAFNDPYILRNVVSANDEDETSKYLQRFFLQLRKLVMMKASLRRWRVYGHRSRTMRSRVNALVVLNRKGINENEVRTLIIKLAGLW